MKTNKFQLILTSILLLVLVSTFIPVNKVSAVTCTYEGCNGLDPQYTTCWNDATIANWAYGSDGIMINRNMYSPTCFSNWSYTRFSSATYLAAETVDITQYDGTQPWVYVWNSMWNGRYQVCTRGWKGTSQGNYNVYSNSVCA